MLFNRGILADMKTPEERRAIILLLILIAIGGIIMYGNDFPGTKQSIHGTR